MTEKSFAQELTNYMQTTVHKYVEHIYFTQKSSSTQMMKANMVKEGFLWAFLLISMAIFMALPSSASSIGTTGDGKLDLNRYSLKQNMNKKSGLFRRQMSMAGQICGGEEDIPCAPGLHCVYNGFDPYGACAPSD
ncbi:hypothetical protein EC973_007402 [Apophysomyces ossiformis]|uniref:Uncharacterized protein n=1 Tax=Apophysomyces ossiformis TaxID=679940 RepID=A0A8H7BUQ7_9FUNG|nr:hypothetical protein EC973_007402 [Apophysomyces ossiformis]